MATFNNGESLASVRTKINDAIDKIDGNATISNDISVGGNITVTGTVDGRDLAADGTKLDAIEASADVTDTANVTAAGALMDSELTSEASVKALDQGVATTDSPTFAGLTTTADVSFGDNDKAIFGAGSDLQIYHDGSNSYISDQGTGNIILDADDSFQVKRGANTSAVFDTNAEVALYHNNSPKLSTTSTGVDITGTLTSDGLTVSSSGTANSLTLTKTDTNATKLVAGNTDGTHTIEFNNGGMFVSDTTGLRLALDSGGDISFYEDTGTTAKLTWSASAEQLQLDAGVALELNGWTITESGGSLYFATGGTNKMKLDASGNLDVVGSVNANATIS